MILKKLELVGQKDDNANKDIISFHGYSIIFSFE